MIGAAGQASVGENGKTRNVSENNLSKKVETKVVANSFSSIHSVSSDTAVYVAGLVAGQPIDMLVDTGSAVTLVHQRVLNRSPQNFKLSVVGEPVVSANGQPLDIRGKCDLEICVDGVNVVHSVLVAADVTQDCLLGIDFLGKHGCKIDFEAKSLSIGSKIVNLQAKSGGNKVFRISLAETVIVPGRHEIVLHAKVKGAGCGDGLLGLVEPSPSFAKQHDLLLARVVAHPKNNTVPIRLVNPSPTPVTLYKNTSVGTLSELEESSPDPPECNHVTSAVPRSTTQPKVCSKFDLDSLDLTGGQRAALKTLLDEYADIFSSGPADLGRTGVVKHQIDTGDSPPIKQAPRRVPLHQQEVVRQHVEDMLQNGVVRPSTSPWASPIVLVKKKDGGTRFCVDYRKLNDVTRKDAYPLPRIDETLDALAGAKLFSTWDLASGYWQVEMEGADREKTAFTTRHGLFEFQVMAFGLCNAPSTFQRLMAFVLAGLQWQTCLVYLDDVIVFGRDFEEHLVRLREVFERFRQAGLKLKPSKCFLLRPKVPFLGHVISADGVSTDPDKIRAVEQWPIPSNVSDVRSFLGLASYYRRFIEDFAEIASPLHRLTAKSIERFQWSSECDRAFRSLKEKLVTAPVLAFPRSDAKFIVDCDASDYGLGAVISQEQDGSERVIAYASRVLDNRERRYSTTKKEMLAMVYAIRHFRHYLYGRPFTVRTDHNALKWLQSFKEPEGQVARWLELLAQYDYKIEHRPGRKHQNADALSRNPLVVAEDTDQIIQTNAVGNSTSTWVPSWTVTNLRSSQAADPDMKKILAWKQNQTSQPAFREIEGTSKATRSLWAQWNRLQLENGVLYRRWETDDGHGTQLQLVLPRSMVSEVLSALHDAPSAGHLGVTKTLE